MVAIELSGAQAGKNVKGCKMKSTLRCALAAGLVMFAGSSAWAADYPAQPAGGQTQVEVRYDKPEQFTDLSFDSRKREEVLKQLTRHFEKLGRSLPAGQSLNIDVTDVDLAGREDPRLRGINDIRILNGGVDWPRMSLHYVLTQDGKVLRSGDAKLSDMSYLSRLNRYTSNEPLRYEKLMMDEWFDKTFDISSAQQASR